MFKRIRKRFSRRKQPKPPRFYQQRLKPLTDKRLFADDSRKTIERFVRQNATGANFLEKLQSLSDKIQAFKPIEKDFQAVKQLWCNRTAAEIISEKNTVVIDKVGKYNVEGCTDVATALLASARALAEIEGIKAKTLFFRWGTHAGIRVKFGEEDWLFEGGTARKIRQRLFERIENAKRQNHYSEGYGPRALGLNSLSDFHKYSKKQQGQ